jgi:hypothetical protein
MTRKSAKISSKTSSTLGRGLLIHLDLFARTEFNSFVTTSSVVPKPFILSRMLTKFLPRSGQYRSFPNRFHALANSL